jgi:hypothetical protein
MEYSKMTISDLAEEILLDWAKPNFAAKPYLYAMLSIKSIQGMYGADSASSVVAYFLGNARTWRGTVAKAIKAELNQRLRLTIK